MTDTVRIIHEQLLELGIGRLGRRLMFVVWGPDTLKVSRGTDGVLIRYNRGTDLYDVTEYHACTTCELACGVYAENLLDVIRPVLTARVKRTAGRGTHREAEYA
jgi:hypothetical protein